MQQFPNLNDNEVALARAEWRTGHILDDKNVLAISDNQTIYTIFTDINAAVEFVRSALEINKEIEYVIYDKNKSVIKYITPDKGI